MWSGNVWRTIDAENMSTIASSKNPAVDARGPSLSAHTAGSKLRAMLGEEAIVVDDDAEAFDLNVRRLQKKSGGGSVLNLIGSEDGNRQRELDGTGKLLVGDALSSRSDSTSLGRGASFSGEMLSSDPGVKDITEVIGAELNGLGTSNVKDFMFRASAKSSSARVPSAEPAPVPRLTHVYSSRRRRVHVRKPKVPRRNVYLWDHDA